MVLALAATAWWRPGALVDRLGALDPVVRAGLAMAYGSGASLPLPSSEPVALRIGLEQPAREVSERFLSVAIDISQVAGGRWWSPRGGVEVGRGTDRVPPFDFARPELEPLARALSPAYLRIGGTESDHVYYDMQTEDEPATAPPPGYELRLTRERWDALSHFARQSGLDLMFTVNAGPGPRGRGRQWRSDNAESLLRHARAVDSPVAVWELGNEVNGFWFIHGMRHQPSGAQYARDMRRFRDVVGVHFPDARVAGPASVFFPVVGQPFEWKFDVLEEFLERSGGDVDVVSWHYYPQQSRRCPVATRRASAERLLHPDHLDEVRRWSREVRALRDRHAPAAETWLGETGHAQCGGEPGLSGRYVSSLWWLDQLGALARDGESVVVRQTLVGADYGLLDRDTLEPTPDYYASVLWKRLMGRRVLDVRREGDNPYLRAYAHCSAVGRGASLLLVNLHESQPARVHLAGDSMPITRYDLSSPSLESRELRLGGEPLRARGGELPQLRGRRAQLDAGQLEIAPRSSTFVVLGGLAAPACTQAARTPSPRGRAVDAQKPVGSR